MKNRRTVRIILLVAVGMLLLVGCVDGPYQTRKEDINNFNRIHIETSGEFLIEQGDEESLTIEAPRDYLRYIETEVGEGTLIISTRRGFFSVPVRRVTYTITVRDLEEISLSSAGAIKVFELGTSDLSVNLSGAGSIEIDDLRADNLEVNLSSAGAIVIAGEVANQDINLSGVGSYESGDLHTNKTSIHLSGAGSAVIWADDYLDVNVSGVGSVTYFGENPEIHQNVSGLGSVNSRGEH